MKSWIPRGALPAQISLRELKSPRPRCRHTRFRAWTLALVLAAGVGGFPPAASADTITFSADQTIVSTGDAVTVRLVWTVSPLPKSATSYTYRFPSGSLYAPNSIVLNGNALNDSDTRITMASDSVRIALGAIALGTTTVTLRVRATGAIGSALPHFGSLTTGISVQALRGHATRIEGEGATVLLPALQMDTHISSVHTTYNYGGSSQVELKVQGERRVLLKFNMGSVALPGTHEVVAAYIELFPTVTSATGITASAYRVTNTWTEGTQSGASCTAGASWTKRDCVNPWTSGGDYNNELEGTGYAAPTTTFLSIDIMGLAADWLAGRELNQGVILVPSGMSNNSSFVFPSKEGANAAAVPARLVVVIAPLNAYATKGVKDATAEIVPNVIISRVPNQRFVYTVKPSFDAGDTGMNHVTVAIPSTFTLVAVDTVKAAGAILNRNQNEVLASGEFEVFGSASTLDVRFADAVTPDSPDKRIDVIFRAGTPMTADLTGKNFSSIVDHDRRGYAPQAAASGNANDRTGDGDTWLVRTNAASIVSVVVTPTDTTVSAGYSVPYRARANYSDGTNANVTDFAQWSVSPAIGTWVNPGLLLAPTPGNAAVTAQFGGVWSSAATLQVGPPELLQLWVTPSSADVVAGLTQQYEAYGRYSTLDTMLVTSTAMWSLADTSIARVQSPGLVRGKISGSTQLAASLATRTAPSVTVNVTPPELVSIGIAPADTSVALGYTKQLHAWGTYTDGSSGNLRSVVTWQSNPAGILDIDADGLATTLAVGTTNITATHGTITSTTANFTVGPFALVSIAVTPADTSVAQGQSVQMRATGTYSDGSKANLTASVTWQSSVVGVAAISAAGLVTTVATGSTTIQATLGSIMSPVANFNVTPAILVSIGVTPADTSVALGFTGRVRAVGTYSNGSTANITNAVTWQLTPSGRITIGSSGSVTTLALGTTAWTASSGAITSPQASFTVTSPALVSIAVTPADTIVALGFSGRLRATGMYSNGSTSSLTSAVTWQSSPAGLISIDSGGNVTTLATGAASVTARQAAITSPAAAFAVAPPVLVAIAVTPADTSIALGYNVQMTARGTYSNGTTQNLSSIVTWQAAPSGIVDLSSIGYASSRAAGSTSISASLGSVSSPAANLLITPPVLISLNGTPDMATAPIGNMQSYVSTGIYSDASSADLTSSVTWQSLDPGVADFISPGTVQCAAQGVARLVHRLGSVIGDTLRIQVTIASIDSVRIAPNPVDLPPGINYDFTATAYFSDGSSMDVTAQSAWSSNDTTVVAVGAGGSAATHAEGSAGIVAQTLNVMSATCPVTVTTAALDSFYVVPVDTTLGLGSSLAYRARGSLGVESYDFTAASTWSTTDSLLADVTASGLVSTQAIGSVQVGARFGSRDATPGDLTIAGPTVVALQVLPADTTVALGQSVQLRAIATYSDGATSTVTGAVSWQTAPTGIASVSAAGYVTTQSLGVTGLTASLANVTSPAANLTVTSPVLVALNGAPDSASVPAGALHAVTSTGIYSDGSTIDQTGFVTWASLDSAVATIESPGVVHAHAAGVARLLHSLNAVRGDTLQLTVTVPTLDSLRIAPCPLNLPPGGSRQLTAWGRYNNGNVIDVTTQVDWSTSDGAIASIDADGRLTAHQSGGVVVSATQGAVAAPTCSVLVDAAILTALAITPADTTVRLGTSVAYRAWGTAGSDVYDLTGTASWTASDTLVAGIVAGTASTRATGTTMIRASVGSLQASPAILRVDPPVVVAVEVLPATSSIRLGGTKAMTARARFSNNELMDVTASATWSSSAPSVVYMSSSGVGTGIGLGAASITATYASVASSAATLTVLPAVQLEAIATGTRSVAPGTADQLLLTLRLSNRYIDMHRLTALEVHTSGPTTTLRLRVDDGDGLFEPLTEPILASGAPNASRWTATNLNLGIPVAGNQTIFVSGDVSLGAAAHGDSIDVQIPSLSALFWESATAVTALRFPLDSEGTLRVTGFVLAQLGLNAVADGNAIAGTADHLICDVRLPDNGGHADMLEQLAIDQVGTARAAADITQMRLLAGPSPWSPVANLIYTGGRRWSANGLSLAVPVGGRPIRIVANVALTAEPRRTIQAELPVLGARFASGRVGPADAAYLNPGTLTIESPRTLIVENLPVAASGIVRRGAQRLPILGLRLTAYAAETDTLLVLSLVNTSTGPDGPVANPNAQIAAAALWLDTNADGALNATDVEIDAVSPGSGNVIAFGMPTTLALPLENATPVTLLVTVDPDSTTVRDGELLSVALSSGAGLDTAKDLSVQMQGSAGTLSPPVVDGQSANGYSLRPVETRILLAGTSEFVALDFVIPANGFEPDRLSGLRVENSGSAIRTDIASIVLRRDDGNGIFTTADSIVAPLAATGQRIWETAPLSFALDPATASRFFVTTKTATTALPGSSFQARVPLDGIRVASGNDGPNDFALDGGGPVVMTAGNQVTWVAGIVGEHTVRPDARKQVVMVLETLNGYSGTRHLSSLALTLRGTASASEYDTWALYPDTNRNGRIDDTEVALGVASPTSGRVQFVGLDYAIQPLQQQRLLVAYTLATANARDGSVVDVVISNAESFGYAEPGTSTLAQFEMDSLGEDTIDGHIVRQIVNHPVTSQSLGGNETHVLALDLTLPSNGWAPDVLEALEVQIVPGPDAASFGEDVTAFRLWREQDTNVRAARFDPGEDVLLRSLAPGELRLSFEALATEVPVGGQRFYVTADIGPTIVDGRALQLRLPIDGVTMQSGNDGPLDAVLTGVAIHRLSASMLLATTSVENVQVSRGQAVDLQVLVRNRGSVALNGVIPLAVDWSNALPVRVLSGPSPASLDLAPGQGDTLAFAFAVDAAGETQCSVTVGTSDSTVIGNAAFSPVITVQEPPSLLQLEMLSNLPTAVSRGQANITPVIWRFTHPDTAAFAAPIALRRIRLEVENSTNGPQFASAVFSRLELRAGGQQLVLLETVPDSSSVTLQLDPELILNPGTERDVLLIGTIASTATASSFRLRLTSAGSIASVDANSGAPVALTATLPWASNLALIRTEASEVGVAFAHTLAASANRGQVNVPAGRITFTLPGAAGESEARITQLALEVRDPIGARLDPRSFIDRLELSSGTATLLSTTQLDTIQGRLQLPLTIQKSIASGAPEAVDIRLDLRDDAPAGPFVLWIPDAAAFTIQDAISGAVLAVQTTAPDTLPLNFGSVAMQSPAPNLALVATARTPAATVPGALDLAVADLRFTHTGATETADILLRSITFRILDAGGAGLEPRDLLQSARLLQGTSVLASVDAPPAGSASVRFDLATPLRMAPGTALDLRLVTDLSAALSEAWIRFSFETTAFGVEDANDSTRALFVTGTIPFATPLVQVVQPTTAAALGVAADPPANAPRGVPGFEVLALQIAHPGNAAQAPLSAAALTILLRDAAGNPLVASAVAGGARLRTESTVFEAAMAQDSLQFDLSMLAAVEGGARVDLALELDVLAAPAVADLRLRVEAGGFTATSAGRPLQIQALAGTTLPYVSPAIHLTAANLRESLSNYPNPFVAGRESTKFTFYLPEPAMVTAEIYALDGSRVVRLLQAVQLPAGLYDNLEWNGRNGAGNLVRNGTYLLRVDVSGPQGGKLLRKVAVKR